MKQKLLIVAAFISLSSVLYAHPGHGGAEHDVSEGYTITHYFTEPFHLAIMALIAIVACYVSVKIYKRNSRKDKKVKADNTVFVNER
ncbi:hypothetical protein ACI6Q2_13415 [Chitinophagaceae bacterium LWZ2-11]